MYEAFEEICSYKCFEGITNCQTNCNIERIIFRIVARKTPIVIPGQYFRPNISNAAIAIPVGGQTGEVFGWTWAINNPSSAAK